MYYTARFPGAPLPQGGRPAPLDDRRHAVRADPRCSRAAGGGQCDGFLPSLGPAVAEQVLDVPMVSSSSCSSRAVLREPQMAEQLVDVPIQHIVELLLSILSTFRFFRLVSLAEVNKVFSLDRVRSASRSLTFLPQVVEFLAVFLGFHPRTVFHSVVFFWERTSERIVEETVFPSREVRISERIVEQTVAGGDFFSCSTSWRSSCWSSRFSSGSGLRSGFFSSSWRR